MNTYIELPLIGANPYYDNPVALASDLPFTDLAGALRLVTGENTVYAYDGAAWAPLKELLAQASTSDTPSVDLTVTNGVLSADLKLSAVAAAAGNLSPALIVEADGLRSELPDADVLALLSAAAPLSYNSATGAFTIPAATATVDGYLDNADWATFNAKEPAVALGTTSQYYRGDKSWAALNIAALTADTGTVPAAGAIGETVTATQAANTSTGVGASGTYGAVASVALTAGVWQLSGTVGFHENSAVLTVGYECGISASATGVGISEFDTTLAPYLTSGANDAILPTPLVYVTIAAPGTYYLNTRFTYTAGSPQHRGRLIARRVR